MIQDTDEVHYLMCHLSNWIIFNFSSIGVSASYEYYDHQLGRNDQSLRYTVCTRSASFFLDSHYPCLTRLSYIFLTGLLWVSHYPCLNILSWFFWLSHQLEDVLHCTMTYVLHCPMHVIYLHGSDACHAIANGQFIRAQECLPNTVSHSYSQQGHKPQYVYFHL